MPTRNQLLNGQQGCIPPQWQTVYEVDFTTQAAQDFKAGGDGAYTIASKSWTIANTANASTLAIGATGLGGTSTGGGMNPPVNTSTAPMAYIALTSLVPNLSMRDGIRVTAYNSTNNKINSYEGTFLAVGTSKADISVQWWYLFNAGLGFQTYWVRAGAGDGVALTDNPADNDMCLEIPSLGGREMRTFTAVHAAPWPAESAWRTRTETEFVAGTYASPGVRLPADVYLYLIGQNSVTVANFDWRYSKLKIERRL